MSDTETVLARIHGLDGDLQRLRDLIAHLEVYEDGAAKLTQLDTQVQELTQRATTVIEQGERANVTIDDVRGRLESALAELDEHKRQVRTGFQQQFDERQSTIAHDAQENLARLRSEWAAWRTNVQSAVSGTFTEHEARQREFEAETRHRIESLESGFREMHQAVLDTEKVLRTEIEGRCDAELGRLRKVGLALLMLAVLLSSVAIGLAVMR